MKVENFIKRIAEARFILRDLLSKQHFLYMAFKDSRDRSQKPKPPQGKKSKKKIHKQL